MGVSVLTETKVMANGCGGESGLIDSETEKHIWVKVESFEEKADGCLEATLKVSEQTLMHRS